MLKAAAWKQAYTFQGQNGYIFKMTKTQVGHFELIQEEVRYHNRQLDSSQEKYYGL